LRNHLEVILIEKIEQILIENIEVIFLLCLHDFCQKQTTKSQSHGIYLFQFLFCPGGIPSCHRVRHQISRKCVRIPPGCKVVGRDTLKCFKTINALLFCLSEEKMMENVE
jgi:hypothetical protein